MTKREILKDVITEIIPQESPYNSLVSEVRKAISTATGVEIGDFSLADAPATTGYDFGINLVGLAKKYGLDLQTLKANLISSLSKINFVSDIADFGPYVNIRLEISRFGMATVDQVLLKGKDYGKENVGRGQVVVVDMSSPNVAKEFSFGHLRSTIIGRSIANLYEFMGYEALRDNHIGDWGTQFGNLITGLKSWGNETELMEAEDPITYLQSLYVRFGKESETQKATRVAELEIQIANQGIESVNGLPKLIEDLKRSSKATDKIVDIKSLTQRALSTLVVTELEKEGQNWFLLLERGDPEARRLWKICVDLSMKKFEEIYDWLGVKFDLVLGESFYEPMLTATMEEAEKVGEISEGALVVNMNDAKKGVAIIRKSDGASVYMTRDLASAIYRQKELSADKIIYVVGKEQEDYFKQLFEILKRLGYKVGQTSEHVYFGLVGLEEEDEEGKKKFKKMSSRKGRVILLSDVIEEGTKRVTKLIQELGGDFRDEKNIRAITAGAIVWNDLKKERHLSITFDWDKALALDGNSAPYVQYAAVRAMGIIDKSGLKPFEIYQMVIPEAAVVYDSDEEKLLVKLLAIYPKILLDSMKNNQLNLIANYTFELSKAFNVFYGKLSVIKEEDRSKKIARFKLVAAVNTVITSSLSILGIEVPTKM